MKKADKGSCDVIMDTEHKINEGQTQLDNLKHYRPLDEPMVKEIQYKVQQLIQDLNKNKHNLMTWQKNRHVLSASAILNASV